MLSNNLLLVQYSL